jgi:hypothetical protein
MPPQLLQGTMEQPLYGHRAHLHSTGDLAVAEAPEHNLLNHLPLARIQTLKEGLHRFTLPFVRIGSGL